jgi:hypothetical protein
MILTGNDEKYKGNISDELDKSIISNNLTTSVKKTPIKLENDSNKIHGHDKKKEKLKNSRNLSKSKKDSSRSTSRRSSKIVKNQNENEKDKKPRHDSMDSTDRYISSLPKNKNGLRPPFVWNFPIERIEEIREKLQKNKDKIEEVHRSKHKRMTKKQQKPKLDIVFKEESKKNEIRKVNAFPYYHDGRIERFIDLFNELFINCMKYAKSKGNTWEYVYCKILNVLGIEYIFKTPKEEIPSIAPVPDVKDEKKDGEKKDDKEKKEGEAKEGELKGKDDENKNEENKEEDKGEGENKEEVKEEEKKEGETKENEPKVEEVNKLNVNEEEKNAN